VHEFINHGPHVALLLVHVPYALICMYMTLYYIHDMMYALIIDNLN